MAKDDFFIIAYKILSYLYACMKAGEDPHLDELGAESLGINEGYRAKAITMLYENGYIKGVREVHTPWMTDTLYDFSSPEITMSGIEFLQENSAMEKAKQALKDLKAMVPMI